MSGKLGFLGRTRDAVVAAMILFVLMLLVACIVLADEVPLPAMIAVDRFPAKPDCSKWESETVSENAARKFLPAVGLATIGLFESDDWLIVRVPADDFLVGIREVGPVASAQLAPWDESWYGPEDKGTKLYFAYVESGSFGDAVTVFAARSGLVEIPIWRGGRRPMPRDRAEKERTP